MRCLRGWCTSSFHFFVSLFLSVLDFRFSVFREMLQKCISWIHCNSKQSGLLKILVKGLCFEICLYSSPFFVSFALYLLV